MSRFRVGCPRLLTWVAVAGLALLIFGQAVDGAPVSAQPRSTLSASPADAQVRLTGIVVPGTVRVNGSSTSFTLDDSGDRVPVVIDQSPAGSVREGQKVVVVGEMRSDGVWVADRVTAPVGTLWRVPYAP